MRNQNGTARILAFILCLFMIICSIDLSTLEVQAANDTTIIDVTGLATGTETSHDCNRYLTSKYNESQHWQECTVCGKLCNKESHNIIDSGWTRGNPNDCNDNNIHKFNCSCGYSYSNTVGKKQHNFSKVQNIGSYSAYETCYDCSQSTSRNYHKCKKADGSLIYGENLGTCAICGYNYTYVYHHAVESYYKAGEYVKCFNGENLAYVNENKYIIDNIGKGTMITNITVPSNYKNINNGSYDQYSSDTNVRVSLNSVNVIGNNWTANQTVTYTGHSENVCRARILFTATKDDNCNILLYMNKEIYPENEAPIISTITQQNLGYSNGWTTSKKITIKGTENYCQIVNIKIKDSKGNIVASGKSSTDKTIKTNYALGGNWTFDFTPNIETDEKGETYTAIVSDSFGYESQKQFVIKQIDSKAPTPTSINTTETKWSKSKSFTASATDKGSGKVQIAFNNTSGYALATANGTSFSRNYTFTGDVYGNVTAAVYFKDAVGNERTNFIKIYNIDNTAPTITDVTGSAVEDEKVEFVVSANDNKDFGGTVGIKSGSGVSKYAISSNNTAPASGWQTSNKLYATSPGTYYIFAKDAVGNISVSYQVDVIKLTLNFNGGKFNSSSTSKVMLGAICGSKTSHTFDIKTYYGTLSGSDYNSKGLNTKLTKTDTNGIQYRFLGYSLDPDATVPDANFDVYAKGTRTENYNIKDNTTLYAVWEPVLQMTVQLSAPSHPGTIELTDDLPVNTALGNFKILRGTKNTDLPSSGTASVNSATIGVNVTNADLVSYTVNAKGASNIKFSTAADSRILDIYNNGKNNPWFDNLNKVENFNYSRDFNTSNGFSETSSFTIPQYLGTTQSYQTSNPDLASGTAVYGIKFTCTQPSYYYKKYWNSDESTSAYCILFLKATASSGTTGGTGGTGGTGNTGGVYLPPYAVEDGMYDFYTILN